MEIHDFNCLYDEVFASLRELRAVSKMLVEKIVKDAETDQKVDAGLQIDVMEIINKKTFEVECSFKRRLPEK